MFLEKELQEWQEFMCDLSKTNSQAIQVTNYDASCANFL